jgi:ubiquinone/menaquinone biosynthesis C-methylase UbiE
MGGRRQPEPFRAERAALLDDPERERWLPTQRIVAMLDVRDGAQVLDYGTGTGRYALAVARAHSTARIVAFDIQREMLNTVDRRAAESGLQNVRTAGPAQSDIAERSFDRVIGVHLLHEIDDEHLLHVRQSLKPGGRLLIIDWDRNAKRDFGPPPEHVHTLEEALERLQHAGFTSEALDSADFPYHFAIRATR